MVELTPQVHNDGYWGWYYEACAGYNRSVPRHGVVQGTTLYRANYTLLDSHTIGGETGPPPPPPPPPVDPCDACPASGTWIFSSGFEDVCPPSGT